MRTAPGRSRRVASLEELGRRVPPDRGEPGAQLGPDAGRERRLLLGEIVEGRRRLALVVPEGEHRDQAHGEHHEEHERPGAAAPRQSRRAFGGEGRARRVEVHPAGAYSRPSPAPRP